MYNGLLRQQYWCSGAISAAVYGALLAAGRLVHVTPHSYILHSSFWLAMPFKRWPLCLADQLQMRTVTIPA
jgi:hypothetical protein